MKEHHRAVGVITLMQEDRIRLETPDGVGMLLVLGRRMNVSSADVERLVGTSLPVRVTYEGTPDIGAVALRIERLAR